jgi:uncharacterized membrane protein
MAISEENGRKGASRGFKIALGLSLAINLAVAGLIAGALLRPDGLPGRSDRAPGLNAFGAPYMMALPRSDRRKVLAAIRVRLAGEVPDRQARRALFRDVLAGLRAEPFDRARLESAIARQAQTTIAVQAAAQKAWLDIVTDMSVAERLEYAYAVEEVLRRGPTRR